MPLKMQSEENIIKDIRKKKVKKKAKKEEDDDMGFLDSYIAEN